jgi:hypothetical protein
MGPWGRGICSVSKTGDGFASLTVVDDSKAFGWSSVASVHFSKMKLAGRSPWEMPDYLLIKAAPDLLAALEMIRDADDDCKADGLFTIPAPTRAAIDAAIANATGVA